MAMLVIHDLPESVELDREAMAAVTGGSMVQAHQTLFARRQTFTGLPLGSIASAEARTPFGKTAASPPHVRTTLLR